MTDNNNPTKKIIFTMGGKGGTGKTTFTSALCEWYEDNQLPVVRLDFDTENKRRGSLIHYFPSRTNKIDIHTPAGLDAFMKYADSNTRLIIADMGASSGQIVYDWFEDMYEVVKKRFTFTAIGLLTEDPATVENLLTWADHLQDKVSYLVVLNEMANRKATFTYWYDSMEADSFRSAFHPSVVRFSMRIPELQQRIRNHGVTLRKIRNVETSISELADNQVILRAESSLRKDFKEFDQIKEVLLP